MWFRSSVILRSFFGLIAAIVMLSVFYVGYLEFRWGGFGLILVCFLPAIVIAARLAQRLDLTQKNAAWIGIPTILTMALVTAFSFFIFSATGERLLADSYMAMSLVVVLAAIVSCLYLSATRLAFPSTREKRG